MYSQYQHLTQLGVGNERVSIFEGNGFVGWALPTNCFNGGQCPPHHFYFVLALGFWKLLTANHLSLKSLNFFSQLLPT